MYLNLINILFLKFMNRKPKKKTSQTTSQTKTHAYRLSQQHTKNHVLIPAQLSNLLVTLDFFLALPEAISCFSCISTTKRKAVTAGASGFFMLIVAAACMLAFVSTEKSPPNLRCF